MTCAHFLSLGPKPENEIEPNALLLAAPSDVLLRSARKLSGWLEERGACGLIFGAGCGLRSGPLIDDCGLIVGCLATGGGVFTVGCLARVCTGAVRRVGFLTGWEASGAGAAGVVSCLTIEGCFVTCGLAAAVNSSFPLFVRIFLVLLKKGSSSLSSRISNR